MDFSLESNEFYFYFSSCVFGSCFAFSQKQCQNKSICEKLSDRKELKIKKLPFSEELI